MTRGLVLAALALALPLAACREGEQPPEPPGGGGGFQTSPVPGPPATELGNAYQKAYVAMANAYMEILQEDYNQALTYAQSAEAELSRIRAQGGETLPETVTEDFEKVSEVVAMLKERHPQAADRAQQVMIRMTQQAPKHDLARAEGAGGGAGLTERQTEGPGVAKPEPPPESRPERIRQEGSGSTPQGR